jgi:hypothetical protein
MLKTPPEILRDVQLEVVAREKRRSEDPEYAGVFRNQFETITGKVEHVISELLQNADDAEAQRAKITFDGEWFTFQHNGADFSTSQFRAICSFAVSSKHTFKTTGFRGIGFKSTFSLGDTVHLITPTFQVKFQHPRVTYPEALKDQTVPPDWPITVRVPVKEESRSELVSSMKAWQTAPCSLLFFKNLKEGIHIAVDHFVVQVPSSSKAAHTITKNGEKIWEGHLLSVEKLRLPADARAEIARLRGTSSDAEAECITQIDVLYGKNEDGRIYSILPTSGGKRLSTRFAVNSSFVLGPERDGIKSPSQSATNRFLFAETGRTIAGNLVKVLQEAESVSDELLRAYSLLPVEEKIDGSDSESEASRRLQAACFESLETSDWVLTADFKVARPGEVKLVELPKELSEVWPPKILRQIFSPDAYIVHPDLPATVLKWLKQKGQVTRLENDSLLRALTEADVPRPKSLDRLSALWTWATKVIVTHESQADAYTRPWSDIRLLPAEGEATLRSLGEVYNFSLETAALFVQGGIQLKEIGIYRLDTDWVSSGFLKLKSPPQGWWSMIDCAAVGITRESNFATILASATRSVSNAEGNEPPDKHLLEALWRIHQEAGIPLDADLLIPRKSGDAVSISKRQLLLRTPSFGIESFLPAGTFAQLELAESFYPNTIYILL